MTASVNRFRERAIPVLVFSLQAVNSSQVNGPAIVEPWRYGRTLAVNFDASALASNDSLTFGVERRRRGTSTWDSVFEPNGSTQLKFTVQSGSGTAGTLGARLKDDLPMFGELDLNRLKVDKDIGGQSYDYDAIRFTAINGVAQNVNVSGTGFILDLAEEPGAGDAVEDLLNRQRYTGGVA